VIAESLDCEARAEEPASCFGTFRTITVQWRYLRDLLATECPDVLHMAYNAQEQTPLVIRGDAVTYAIMPMGVEE
jgi:hypothetical protein